MYDEDFYYLSAYPYFVNVSTGKEYVVPEERIRETCELFGLPIHDKNNPVFSQCGLIRRGSAISLLSAVSEVRKIICFNFDHNGSFIDAELLCDNCSQFMTDGSSLYYRLLEKPGRYRVVKFN